MERIFSEAARKSSACAARAHVRDGVRADLLQIARRRAPLR